MGLMPLSLSDLQHNLLYPSLRYVIEKWNFLQRVSHIFKLLIVTKMFKFVQFKRRYQSMKTYFIPKCGVNLRRKRFQTSASRQSKFPVPLAVSLSKFNEFNLCIKTPEYNSLSQSLWWHWAAQIPCHYFI